MTAPDPASVATAVGLRPDGAAAPRWRRGLRPLLGLLALLVVAGAVLAWRGQAAQPRITYQTEAASRGNLVVRVTATGNLQPTNQVDVGSELSGTIDVVQVDDNDRVRKGQELARLDLSKLNDELVRSRGALAAAEAAVQLKAATTQEARTTLARQQEVARLSGGQVPSRLELASAEAALQRAVADEASARAAVVQARATVATNQTNIGKASIRSPIDGVVLTRKVSRGQTVAASLQAPVLFTLAESLSQMELQVAVDEADVGQVREGQQATFTVDAYPGRSYPARITRVGYGSTTTNNVVSYLTILEVDNADLSLRPGMTATAEITTLRRDGVLLVPNAALRWSPPAAADAAAGAGSGSGSNISRMFMPRPPQTARKPAAERAAARSSAQTVWVLEAGQPRKVAVTVGASDGRHTEVSGGALREGQAVITDSSEAAR
ncbi:MAG: efflux RND transporter periplasmic adaptor subunit [Burkholderiales bacterium]|nr:efflux RND transporter periplasmic adaptor subunit [Burkholderiales bacterium]